MTVAGSRRNRGVSRGVEDSAKARKQTADRVDQYFPFAYVDAGETGRFFVGTDREVITTEFRFVEQQSRDDEERNQPKCADGEAADFRVAEIERIANEYLLKPAADLRGRGRPGLGLHFGDDRTDALGHHHGAEGCDKRRQFQLGYEQTVDQTKRGADRDGEHKRQRQRPLVFFKHKRA